MKDGMHWFGLAHQSARKRFLNLGGMLYGLSEARFGTSMDS